MADDAGPGGFAQRLGADVERADDGSARISFEAREEHLNPAGTLHGGVLATLVDTATGTAVRSTIEDGDVPATSQLTVTYLRCCTAEPATVAVTIHPTEWRRSRFGGTGDRRPPGRGTGRAARCEANPQVTATSAGRVDMAAGRHDGLSTASERPRVWRT